MTRANYTVTLYKLFLGDQKDPSGHFQQGFTIHSITERHFTAGTYISVGGMARYTQYDWTGFTAYNVEEGDVILDSFGRHLAIKAVKPWTNGDIFEYNELQLEELAVFPHLSGFFGFEDLDHGTVGGMFEPGFERGEWAL